MAFEDLDLQSARETLEHLGEKVTYREKYGTEKVGVFAIVDPDVDRHDENGQLLGRFHRVELLKTDTDKPKGAKITRASGTVLTVDILEADDGTTVLLLAR